MSTTDILFNSPALHSLKRAQLVQLCKRHNIKASGKNTELVSRLKKHARGLPAGAPLSVAVRSEIEVDRDFFGSRRGDGGRNVDGDEDGDADGDADGGMMTDISDEDNVEEQLTSPMKERESQVWEIVSRGSVDSKRSVATRNQPGEFGAATNPKSTILRSIASSIGLARSPSSNSIPAGESSDSLAPTTSNKKDSHKDKDKDFSSSPKARSIFSSLLPRSRSNSHESQPQPQPQPQSQSQIQAQAQTQTQTKYKEDYNSVRKSLLTNAIPYNEIPVPSVSRRPLIEPFAFSYAGVGDTSLGDVSMASLDRPVPGVGPCYSVNANDGVGTVRLITNSNTGKNTGSGSGKMQGEEEDDIPKLPPVVPAFDLIPPTPGKTGLHRFPAESTPEAPRTKTRTMSLYPRITEDDMSVDLDALTSPTKKGRGMERDKDKDKSLPDLPELSPSPVSPASPTKTSARDPFIFGSPNPRHSTTPADFSHAASSVLAEMNARLGAAGGKAIAIDPKVLEQRGKNKLDVDVDVDALLKYEFGCSGTDVKGGSKEEGKGKEGSIGKKFEKMHEKAFSRMDGIDTHYTAKRGLKDKSKDQEKDKDKDKEKLEPLPGNRKRKQSVLQTRATKKSTAPTSTAAPTAATKENKSTNTAVGKKKTAVVVIPGAFEADDMDVDESIVRAEISEVNEHEHEPEQPQQDQDEDNDNERTERGAKRACVASPAADGTGETRRISIAPNVRKDISDDDGEGEEEEEMNEEKKRKQSEAIRRRLELNKARRRSSRGRPSTMAARSPIKKEKGFLASAKSFVKSVWNRGGNPPTASAKNISSVPSYLRATASSASKTGEQEAKTTQAPAIGTKPPPSISRAPSVRSSSVGSIGLARKVSGASQKQAAQGYAPPSGLETVAEGESEKTAPSQAQTTQVAAPILGSVKPRNPSAAVSLARKPSRSGATNVAGRSSRLLAPTASSLAKVNASPTKPTTLANGSGAALRSKTPSVRSRASVMSPSRIPIFSPPRKNQSIVPASVSKKIFNSPLVLPTSPQARSAAEKGQDINPITGALSPSRQRVPFSSSNGQTQSLMGAATALKKEADKYVAAAAADEAKGKEGKVKEQNGQNGSPAKINKALNSLRKPRISRSKLIARLSPHRERGGAGARAGAAFASIPGSPRAQHSPGKTASAATGLGSGNKGPATPKVKSSTGMAARRSVGGPKARESGAGAVILSAKKRARTTEYARRKSARSPIRAPDFAKGRNSSAMEVDD